MLPSFRGLMACQKGGGGDDRFFETL